MERSYITLLLIPSLSYQTQYHSLFSDTLQFGEEIVASLESIVKDFRDGKRTESQTLTLLYRTVREAAVKLDLGPEMAEPLSCPYVQQVLAHIEQTKMAAERGNPIKGDPSEDEGDTE
ncbi:hypothetical protein ARMGADRAFT_1086894 [Armillaria gallica]|uniref:Uncharacterized protein n=1 Tax=Armillaria gallica TaxID=47427 RepID=A0A2H3D421_ARMGA|nr:hypothetical protein ARMGADRAFT_1086894 [Armillaria gallica]